MIRLYAIAGLLAVCLGLAWQVNRQTDRADAAEAALASATARLQQLAEAQAVHHQHLAFMARQQAAYEALVTEFETMEGSDAPLSPYLRALDQRLR